MTKTLQETFDTVVGHLRKQGKRASYNGGSSCWYRTPDGLKCAVGCLIPDDRYDSSLEDKSAIDPDLRSLLRDLGYDDRRVLGMLDELQDAHDGTDPPEWEARFREVATTFGISYSPPTSEAG